MYNPITLKLECPKPRNTELLTLKILNPTRQMGQLALSNPERGPYRLGWLENVDICTDTYPYIDTRIHVNKLNKYNKIHRYIQSLNALRKP